MVIKMSLVMLAFVALLFSCVHDNCVRSFSGKIKYGNYKQDLTVIIKKHNYSYSEWFDLDSLYIHNGKENYELELAEHHPQKTCNNNCPDGNKTMADSIRIIILSTSDKKLLKDTVFDCDDYSFIGDDIQLPTINLQ